MATTLQKLSNKKATELTEDEFVNLITSTAQQEAVLTDLQTLGPFKVILFKKKSS